jgi:uncharacterized protein (TIGR02246 family)
LSLATNAAGFGSESVLMNSNKDQLVSVIVSELEKAWNAADGDGFARPFADDADFVNVRGEHHRTRASIARGHQVIFDTIYKGSVVRYQVAGVREIAPGVLVAQVRALLKVPTGPLAGDLNALATLVFVEDGDVLRIAAFHNTLVA